MFSGYLFGLVLFYIQGHEVDFRCGVWKGGLDKNFESFLWISVSVHKDMDVHFLNPHILHLSDWRLSKNMRGNVTLGMGSRTSFSLAARMGHKSVCGRMTGQSCSGTLP